MTRLVMNTSNVKSLYCLVVFLMLGYSSAQAQEIVAPLLINHYQTSISSPSVPSTPKKRVSLPFIDDFSYDSPFPDPLLWVDRQVYINNTMSNEPPTRGMATFDGLNQYGRPYYPNQFSSGFADSLTSQPINLSTYTPADSLYLSFYFQPQGLGYSPELNDSLLLYFKNNANQWIRMWAAWGTPWQRFKIQMIAVADPQFFHNDFQFRFINIASLNLNDDNWNLDYIKLDANRNQADSNMNDLAMTLPPWSILSPYQAMPYRHFVNHQATESSSQQLFQIGNLYNLPQTVSPNHLAFETSTLATQQTLSLPTVGVAPKSVLNQSATAYTINHTPPTTQSQVVIRNKYYIQSPGITDRRSNDTITRDVVFDNYFAYDDGTAEKSYFLYPAQNFPAKTALQFHTNVHDTVRGLMVFFAGQAPTALNKYFSIILYKQLAGAGLTDSILRKEDLFQVKYDTLHNGFVSYAFSSPVVVDPGTYYIGIMQPANFGSDSIYYGLDVNTNNNIDYLYYNVDGNWFASSTIGTIMMRPILGPPFTPTSVEPTPLNTTSTFIHLYPNPSTQDFYVKSDQNIVSYKMSNLQGAIIATGKVENNRIQWPKDLPPGPYICLLQDQDNNTYTHTIQKK